jgi:hypothetical protein
MRNELDAEWPYGHSATESRNCATPVSKDGHMDYEMEIFGAIVSVLVLAMICVCGIDIRNYLRKNTIIGLNQLIFRMIGGVFITMLLIKVLYGIYWVDHHVQGSDHFIHYWSKCTILAFISFAFAGVDTWITMRLRKEAQKVEHRVGTKLNDIYRTYAPPETEEN